MENKLERPIIKIKPTLFDKVIETIAILTLVAIWINVLYHYKSLPTKIPSHFNLQGEIDSYSHKGVILILPMLGIILWFLLSFISKYPHTFNIPVKLTIENAKYQYRLAQRMLRLMKTYILLEFLLISVISVLLANGYSTPLQSYLAISFSPLFLILIIYFYLASKNS